MGTQQTGVSVLSQPSPYAASKTVNVTAATVIKPTEGMVFTVMVVVAGSGNGGVYDNNSTSGNTAANQIAATPQTLGLAIPLNCPCTTGITVVPGTGQTIAISWS